MSTSLSWPSPSLHFQGWITLSESSGTKDSSMGGVDGSLISMNAS